MQGRRPGRWPARLCAEGQLRRTGARSLWVRNLATVRADPLQEVSPLLLKCPTPPVSPADNTWLRLTSQPQKRGVGPWAQQLYGCAVLLGSARPGWGRPLWYRSHGAQRARPHLPGPAAAPGSRGRERSWAPLTPRARCGRARARGVPYLLLGNGRAPLPPPREPRQPRDRGAAAPARAAPPSDPSPSPPAARKPGCPQDGGVAPGLGRAGQGQTPSPPCSGESKRCWLNASSENRSVWAATPAPHCCGMGSASAAGNPPSKDCEIGGDWHLFVFKVRTGANLPSWRDRVTGRGRALQDSVDVVGRSISGTSADLFAYSVGCSGCLVWPAQTVTEIVGSLNIQVSLI